MTNKKKSVAENLNSLKGGIRPCVDAIDDLLYKKGLSGNSWFVTGHFYTDGHLLNFMLHLSILAFPNNQDNVMVNAVFSVTDETTGQYFSEDKFFPASSNDFADDKIDVKAPNYLISGNLDELKIKASMEHCSIDITARATGYALYNGCTGILTMFGMDGYQYSIPTMDSAGIMMIDNNTYNVSGITWLDRQYSTPVSEDSISGLEYNCHWVWMGLNFDNQDRMSLWGIIDDTTGKEFSWATVLHPDGTQTLVSVEPLSKAGTEHWLSPSTNQNYPTKWNVVIPELNAEFEVVSAIKEQEIVSEQKAGNKYEGASQVNGTYKGKSVTGYCYVELVGDWQ